MITFLISAIKIIVLLGLLIFIHELGHFTVAKLCNVRVNEFAIGFGPTIYKKQGKETKYNLRLIPLGGFISMEGEEERSDDIRSFSKVSIPKRMAIVFAGPIVNIVFATIIYFLLTFSAGPYISNEVNEILPGYGAENSGIQVNDKIVGINGNKVESKYDLSKILDTSNGENLNIEVNRNGEILQYNVIPTEVKLTENMSTYYIGISFKPAQDNFINRCINGGISTKEFLFSIVDNMKQLFTGKVGVEQMMGPVGISEVVAKTDGFMEFIQMMALISLSLGVTNLLPIPALDGGKILLLVIEAIRRRPLNEKLEINIQLLGFSFLIILSLYITYNDILRIF